MMARTAMALVMAASAACGAAVGGAESHPRSAGQPPASARSTPALAPAPPYRIFVQQAGDGSQGQISVVDTGAHAVQRTLPMGVATGDWSRLYTVEAAGSTSTLHVVDPRTGAVLRTVALAATVDVTMAGPQGPPIGLSPNQRWLALAGGTRDADQRLTTSRFVIVDTTFATPPRTVLLPGDITFDGIDNSGTRLYLLENIAPAGAGVSYRVREYHLDSRSLDPAVIVDKTDGGAAMSGTRLAVVDSRDGAWQYGVYAFGERGPFIHALNLEGSIAVCIDLPAGRANGEEQLLWSLALSPDGATLYAVNGALGVLAVDTEGLAVRGRATFAATPAAAVAWPGVDSQAKLLVESGAVLAPDGRTLYAIGTDEVAAIDTASLRIRARLASGEQLASLAVTPDGAWLWGVTREPASLLRIDVRSGAVRPDGVSSAPQAVLRVEAAGTG